MFNIDAKLSLIETGSWGEFQGSKFLITHISNLRFQRALARLQQPHRRKIDTGSMDPALSKDLMCKAMSEALVLDWQNVVDKDKNPVPFNVDNCYKALSRDPEFREFVTDYAINLQNFRDEEIAQEGKS
jgi:hypothetical protein